MNATQLTGATVRNPTFKRHSGVALLPKNDLTKWNKALRTCPEDEYLQVFVEYQGLVRELDTKSLMAVTGNALRHQWPKRHRVRRETLISFLREECRHRLNGNNQVNDFLTIRNGFLTLTLELRENSPKICHDFALGQPVRSEHALLDYIVFHLLSLEEVPLYSELISRGTREALTSILGQKPHLKILRRAIKGRVKSASQNGIDRAKACLRRDFSGYIHVRVKNIEKDILPLFETPR